MLNVTKCVKLCTRLLQSNQTFNTSTMGDMVSYLQITRPPTSLLQSCAASTRTRRTRTNTPEYMKKRFVVEDGLYTKVRAQNFDPIPLSEIRDSSLHPTSLPTHKFEKRESFTFDGLKYTELPIINILARYNNTIINFSDGNGKLYGVVSSRTAGFFNAKKKTPHAGEMTGKLAAERAIERGLTNKVRVIVKGIGVGRLNAIKGLMMGGMDIISITDKTPLYLNGLPQRPRKIRRI